MFIEILFKMYFSKGVYSFTLSTVCIYIYISIYISIMCVCVVCVIYSLEFNMFRV